MTRLFVSYATEDRPTAERLASSLTASGWDVWWDRRLLPGSRFDEVIEAHLDEADAVVVIWSVNSVVSEWVRAEATTAAERGVMIPVLIEPCRIPLRFRNIQAIDLSDWSGDPADERIDRLREAVGAVTASVESDIAAPEPETTTHAQLNPAPTNVETAPARARTGHGAFSAWSRRWRVAAAVVIVLLVGAAGYALITSDGDSSMPTDDERAPVAAPDHDADTLTPPTSRPTTKEADVSGSEDGTPVGRTDGLDAGEWLYADDERHSADGRWLLLMQADGNLVVEDEWNPADRPIWSSNTSGVPGARAVMQPDGNFVILDYSTGENRGAIFSTGTSGNPGAMLTIQNDGAVVVRSRSGAQLFNSLVDAPSG